MIRTIDIAIVDTGMLPIALHLKNLPPEKWPHAEQARCWTHAEHFYILEQPAEFRRYIRARDRVIATLASQAAISSASRRGSCIECSEPAGGCAPTAQAWLPLPEVCPGSHAVDRYRVFQKMSPGQCVVKVNELQLCQICLRHLADMACSAKAEVEYKWCNKSKYGMDHHPLLHWALIVARLFQVQVAPESYPAGTQQFKLQQQAMMGETEVGLAFDGGSNPMVVTRDYGKRMKLKKVGSGFPVVWQPGGGGR